MKVKTTCTIKGTGIGVISMGTVFEGTEETLPSWILPELALNRGILEVLPEPKRAVSRPKAIKPKKEALKKKEFSKKPDTLREKLTKTEK